MLGDIITHDDYPAIVTDLDALRDSGALGDGARAQVVWLTSPVTSDYTFMEREAIMVYGYLGKYGAVKML